VQRAARHQQGRCQAVLAFSSCRALPDTLNCRIGPKTYDQVCFAARNVSLHGHQQVRSVDTDKRPCCRNEQEREVQLLPCSSYLDNHDNELNPEGFITPQMRMIVTSWISEVAAEFRLQQETLFLAVALMDRFLTVSKVRP